MLIAHRSKKKQLSHLFDWRQESRRATDILEETEIVSLYKPMPIWSALSSEVEKKRDEKQLSHKLECMNKSPLATNFFEEKKSFLPKSSLLMHLRCQIEPGQSSFIEGKNRPMRQISWTPKQEKADLAPTTLWIGITECNRFDERD